MRHDRTIIDSYGGVWPQIADAVRADMLSTGPLSSPLVLPAPTPDTDLRSRRKALGLTQTELAVRAGYATSSSISKIELGESQAGIARLERALADAEQS